MHAKFSTFFKKRCVICSKYKIIIISITVWSYDDKLLDILKRTPWDRTKSQMSHFALNFNGSCKSNRTIGILFWWWRLSISRWADSRGISLSSVSSIDISLATIVTANANVKNHHDAESQDNVTEHPPIDFTYADSSGIASSSITSIWPQTKGCNIY